MNSKYDVAVVYRIYPRVSKVPPVFKDDKYELAKLCLKSFRNSLASLKAKIWVLLDNCPPEYFDLFKIYFESDDLELINLKGVGNHATFKIQIEILLNQNFSDIVYFAEDDYFYISGKFKDMITFLKENKDVDFVSPYDHLDYYTLDIHKYESLIKCSDNQHWRTAASTCLTFLTTKAKLSEASHVFESYARGNYDASLWLSLTKYKLFNPVNIFQYFIKDKFLFEVIKKAWLHNWREIFFIQKKKLWVPVPSIATHMESNYLAPTIDWLNLINQETVIK